MHICAVEIIANIRRTPAKMLKLMMLLMMMMMMMLLLWQRGEAC